MLPFHPSTLCSFQTSSHKRRLSYRRASNHPSFGWLGFFPVTITCQNSEHAYVGHHVVHSYYLLIHPFFQVSNSLLKRSWPSGFSIHRRFLAYHMVRNTFEHGIQCQGVKRARNSFADNGWGTHLIRIQTEKRMGSGTEVRLSRHIGLASSS